MNFLIGVYVGIKLNQKFDTKMIYDDLLNKCRNFHKKLASGEEYDYEKLGKSFCERLKSYERPEKVQESVQKFAFPEKKSFSL